MCTWNTCHWHPRFPAGFLGTSNLSWVHNNCSPYLPRERGGYTDGTARSTRFGDRRCRQGGARILNLSVALSKPPALEDRKIDAAIDFAASRCVIVVAAAGNQGFVGSDRICRHPWVIPVVACDLRGKPMNDSNLGSSIGRRGLQAPGDRILSLAADGGVGAIGGSSAATPFVRAIALLWSEFLTMSATQIKWALSQPTSSRRTAIVPPVLNAWAAYDAALFISKGVGL